MASLAVSCDEEEDQLSYTITKTAAVDTAGDGIINGVDEIIEYTVKVQNTGNTTITDVSVIDSLITLTRQDDATGNDDDNLDEGETWVYTGSYTVLQSDIDAGSIENTATVSSKELASKTATKEVTIGEIPFASDTVKIGAILPLSGMMGLYGQEFKNGIEFVVDQMEAEGALNGADIEVEWADDGGDPIKSRTEMIRLCTDAGVDAVIGPFLLANGLEACPLADQYQIPNIGIAVTGDEIEALNLQYWRTIVPEAHPGDYGRAIVDFIEYCIEEYDLPHDRIVMISSNDPGEQERSAQLERLEYYGLDENLVLDLLYDPTASSMDIYAQQCKAEDPDIMLGLTLPIDMAGWIKSMQALDYYPNIFVTGNTVLWPPEITQMFIDPDIYNAVFSTDHTSPFCPATNFPDVPLASCQANYEDYSEWCEENNKTNLWETAMVIMTSQAMYALWDALEIAGEADPVKINDALRDLEIPYDSPHFVMPCLYPAVEWNSNGTLKNYFNFILGRVDGEVKIVYPDEVDGLIWKQADPQW